MNRGIVRFDEALAAAVRFCRTHRGQLGADAVLVSVVGQFASQRQTTSTCPRRFGTSCTGCSADGAQAQPACS